ncbi:MAG: hypothetical protein ACPGRX_02665 [Bdellovibrionales bacterium]
MNHIAKSLKGFDWRSLKKYTSAKSAEDLNVFLEKLPQNVGQTMLIMAGVAWAVAGGVGLFTAVQLQKITEIRTELQEAQAIKPIVPQIMSKPVSPNEVKGFVEQISEIYQGLQIDAKGPSVVITSKATSAFGQFREAVGHIQNGGEGWKTTVDSLCVGRECDRDPLSIVLKINTVSVGK